MFMAMKRRVLEMGGYAREFLVSQTPELTAMADAVIDLEVMAGAAERPNCPSAAGTGIEGLRVESGWRTPADGGTLYARPIAEGSDSWAVRPETELRWQSR